MTISLKRRRQLLHELREDAKVFHEAWMLAKVYRRAGASPETARAIIESVKMKKSPCSPEERAWLFKLAVKGMQRFTIEANERRMQGLPPLKSKLPTFH